MLFLLLKHIRSTGDMPWKIVDGVLCCLTSHRIALYSFDLQTATQILTAPVLNHALLFVNKSPADFKDIYAAFNSAAESFRLKVNQFKQQQYIKITFYTAGTSLLHVCVLRFCSCLWTWTSFVMAGWWSTSGCGSSRLLSSDWSTWQTMWPITCPLTLWM